MPTQQELVPNRPLAGSELLKIIEADVHEILSQDGMLTLHAAYRRVSYEVRVILHLDNIVMPESRTTIRSRKQAENAVAAQAHLGAIENAPPLTQPSPDSYLRATERHRDIESPNVARMENALPITVVRRQQDGQHVEESVIYPDDVPQDAHIEPVDTDRTAEVRKEFNLPAAPPPPALTELEEMALRAVGPCTCGESCRPNAAGTGCLECGGMLKE